jgi:PhoH-like ATPase
MNNSYTHYVLDTNILVSDPKSIYKFHEHEVVLPIIVIEELDRLKIRQDQAGACARQAIRELETLRTKDPDGFRNGVDLPNGGRLKIELNHTDLSHLPIAIRKETEDNRILATACALKKGPKDRVVLVTKDANLRIKAGVIGVEAEEYRNEKVEIEELYTGQVKVEVSADTIDRYYKDKCFDLKSPEFDDIQIFPNAMVVLTCGSQSAVGRAHAENHLLTLRPLAKHSFNYPIKPKNIEQEFALDLLMDPKIDLVTLAGPAGTGKTLLALMAGMELVVRQDLFSRLLVSRPVIPMGKDIGFLPGGVDEKMSVWLKPFKDNLEHLMEPNGRDFNNIDHLFEEGIIEVGVLSYIRGRSIPNQFIIIDECQNLERHAIRSVLTRVGKNSRCCLTGDLSQIDHPLLDTVTNGLTHVIENLKDEPSVGHIVLTKGVRSNLATLIAERL